MPISDIVRWVAVLPIAFISGSAITLLGMEYGAEHARRVGGDPTGYVVEWIIFAVRGVVFVAAGTLIAPSARVVVAIILGIIHVIASESPTYNRTCWVATVLGTSGVVLYFITVSQ
jgi:hypothetical protein